MPVPRLFGAETEYAVSHLPGAGSPVERALLVRALTEWAATEVPNLPAYDGRGMFLANGGRLYVDLTGHPEYATAECTSPAELVEKLQESDRTMAMLADRLAGRDGGEVFLTKTNVDYISQAAWGCHESYHIARGCEADVHLIPFLVSRQIYAGSGGWNNLTDRLEFVLSPRVPHFQRVSSAESTHSRGILHTRDESCGRSEDRRLHVIVGEALFSETAMLLKAGATAIVVGLIEAGREPGNGVSLRNPLAAMRRFSLDPECKAAVGTECGRRMTAVEIQRHYLEHARRNLSALPVWAPDVCRLWQEVFDGLESGAEQKRLRLDWVIRRHLFARRLAAHGWTWEDAPEREAHGSGYDAVRFEIYELDTKFGRPGRGGIFHSLEEAGVLEHRIGRAAIAAEPAHSRAHLRGRMILECFDAGRRRDVYADWTFLLDHKRGLTLDLRDPFHCEETWKPGEGGRRAAGCRFFGPPGFTPGRPRLVRLRVLLALPLILGFAILFVTLSMRACLSPTEVPPAPGEADLERPPRG
jgi:proteasome accessory factor A